MKMKYEMKYSLNGTTFTIVFSLASYTPCIVTLFVICLHNLLICVLLIISDAGVLFCQVTTLCNFCLGYSCHNCPLTFPL